MENCNFCNDLLYDDISPESDWRVTMYEDGWGKYYFLNIEHDVWLGDFGTHEYSASIPIMYCPVCGRKLTEEE